MRLSELRPGESGIITKILGHGAFRKRVMEMGFVKGREITMVLNAPMQDPVKYKLMDYEVSLRRAEAALIEINLISKWNPHLDDDEAHKETQETDLPLGPAVGSDRIINVALLGNPNCGKTSLFNMVSGAHEHVGNYAGVTVGAKEGSLNYKGYHINLVDLPGTYSLSAYSPEELYVTRYLRQETPDVIVNVVVASNLERNLYLTTELIDMNRPMVIALNMYDELERSKSVLDYENLGRLLGVPIVPTKASTGWGLDRLLDTVIDVYEMRHKVVGHIHVRMRPEVEQGVNAVKDAIKADPTADQHFSPRYLAVKMLEEDPEAENILKSSKDYAEIKSISDAQRQRIEKALNEDASSAISADKYGFVQGALRETFTNNEDHEEKATGIIDAFVTNKLFGFPIFVLIMWLMFWATFKLGSYPMEWIEWLVSWISGLIGSWMPEGPFKDLLLDGIIGGVGGVIVFLPNILILYAFISFMEDSGYMARVAFIMDKAMHRMGLHGKSFIPLVMGSGGMRTPSSVLLVGCFFPQYGAWVFVGLYLLGICVAVLTARMMRKFWFKADETPFVMELPPYRMPTAKATLRNMWSKAEQYLRKMGGLILVASVIIWCLSYFPRYKASEVPADYRAATLAEMPAQELKSLSEEQIDALVTNTYQQENSILGRIGKFVEPVVRPLDFGWKTSVSLLAGSAAKEVVVSTLGVLYVGEDDADMISERLTTPSRVTGKAPFTPQSALAFMVFVLLYCPCIATLAAIARECGSWKYSLFSVVYNTALAWVLAFVVYRIALLF